MNWKTFKSLNPDLQQEYLFRFKDKPTLSCRGIIWAIAGLIGSLVGLLMISFVVIKDPAFSSVSEQVVDIVKNAQTLITIGVPIIIAYIITDIAKFGYYYTKRYWWMKKWGIKKIPENFWKRE